MRVLEGRTALVTGASRGIGRAIAQRLAAEGAAVVVTASARSEEGLASTVERIVAAGGRAAAISGDLLDDAARATLIEQAAARFGAIDILINNAAGISAYAPPSRVDAAARAQMMMLNLHAPIDLIQQALPAMRERGWGRIINLGSEMARQPATPYPGPAKLVHALGFYGVCKAALHRYTEALAAELHGTGIAVNLLMPYKIVDTESAAEVVRQTAEHHPDWIEPVEVMAEAALWLVRSGQTGHLAVSRHLLQQAQATVHTLDGATALGDAQWRRK